MKVEPSVLAPFVADRYGLVDPRVELLRAGFNDNYLVEAADARFVLRLYLNDKYYIDSPDDFRFELDLLTHLRARDIPVAAPVPQVDGSLLGSIDADGERRWCALFPFAPGAAPEDNTPLPLEALGRAIARVHVEAARFASPHHRYALDRRYLLDEPVRLAAEALERFERGTLDRWEPHLRKLGEILDAMPRTDGAYGIIHGDLHGGNMHVDGESFTLFDFDHCGYGYRAYDLATVRMGLGEQFDVFLNAYREIREPLPAELDALPAFAVLRAVWDIGDILAMHAAWKKDIPEQACERIEAVMGAVAERTPR